MKFQKVSDIVRVGKDNVSLPLIAGLRAGNWTIHKPEESMSWTVSWKGFALLHCLRPQNARAAAEAFAAITGVPWDKTMEQVKAFFMLNKDAQKTVTRIQRDYSSVTLVRTRPAPKRNPLPAQVAA